MPKQMQQMQASETVARAMQLKAAEKATKLQKPRRVVQLKAAEKATKLQMLAEAQASAKQQKALRGALQRWGYVELEEDGECV